MHNNVKLLVVATHPDDETLGCGGTLLKHALSGDELHWVIITSLYEPQYSQADIHSQSLQIEKVKQAYGFKTVNRLDFPTTRLETLALNDIINALRNVVKAIHTEIVYTPNRSDVHSDHRIVSQAMQAVLKSFYMRSMGVRQILAYEVLSETDAAPSFPENMFMPNVFVDVSLTLERKLEIMNLYQTEIQPDPLPRGLSAIRALSVFRGATIGVEHAEAFMLIRELK